MVEIFAGYDRTPCVKYGTRLLLEEKLSAQPTDEVLPQYGFAAMLQ